MQDYKNNEVIVKCLSLEKELSKYKLWGNLIPRRSFYANLRKVLTKKQWDIIRKFVYKKDFYKCSICDKKNIRLEAHEDWEYDYENSIQKLNDINALCRMCHLNNHLGLSGILIREGKLNEKELISHWCNVNNEKEENFREYQEKVFNLWGLRNKFNWKIVDKSGHNILKGLNFDVLLSSLK